MRALVDGKAVSRRSFLEMTSPKSVTAGFTPPYGFGLSLRPVLGDPALWHEGVMAGYTSLLAYLPERDLIIAIITNGRPAPIDEMLRRITRRLTGREASTPRDLPLPSDVATLVAGQYDDAMFKYRIVSESGGLFFCGPFGAPQRLLYQGRRDFAIAGPADFRFSFQPDTGVVKWVEWDWGEIRAFGKRVP
jgi:CubicO group peptidase (beta-lactamase class C family)